MKKNVDMIYNKKSNSHFELWFTSTSPVWFIVSVLCLFFPLHYKANTPECVIEWLRPVALNHRGG